MDVDVECGGEPTIATKGKAPGRRPNPIGHSSSSLSLVDEVFLMTEQMLSTRGVALVYTCVLLHIILQRRFNTRCSCDPSPDSLKLHNVNAE